MRMGEKVEIVSGTFEGHKGTIDKLHGNGTCDIGPVKEIPVGFVATQEEMEKINKNLDKNNGI